ncbi:MAG: DUF2141 domain-containing protein [Halieaceae bacterium]
MSSVQAEEAATDDVATDAVASSTVQIELTGLESAEGNLFIAVYDSKKTWLGDETVSQQKVVIVESREEGIVKAELQLPPGEYALSIFHDSNDNGKLDANFIGIPKEPVALSNNARPKFGPPKYKDAVFELGAEPVLQQISMEEI